MSPIKNFSSVLALKYTILGFKGSFLGAEDIIRQVLPQSTDPEALWSTLGVLLEYFRIRT